MMTCSFKIFILPREVVFLDMASGFHVRRIMARSWEAVVVAA
jgi:hypothetical protein